MFVIESAHSCLAKNVVVKGFEVSGNMIVELGGRHKKKVFFQSLF